LARLPVAHSLSPVLHRSAYAALGAGALVVPTPRRDSREPGPFLAELHDTWSGLSLAMPLKHEALRLADHVDPLAKVVGAFDSGVQHRWCPDRKSTRLNSSHV